MVGWGRLLPVFILFGQERAFEVICKKISLHGLTHTMAAPNGPWYNATRAYISLGHLGLGFKLEPVVMEEPVIWLRALAGLCVAGLDCVLLLLT